MSRLDRLRAEMMANHIDVAVLVPGSNLRYLSGIGFSTKLRLACLIVPLRGQPAMVLPTMEAPRAAAQADFPMHVFGWDDDVGPSTALTAALKTLSVAAGTVAVEHVVMRVFELRAIESALPQARIVNADPLLAQLRMHKAADELAAMQRAIAVAETTLAHALRATRIGMSELQVADLWNTAIRDAGSMPSFDAAVGAGPHGASPHHTNSTRPLQLGDLVVIDGGAIVDGYVSDITRTIAIGEPAARARLVYDTVYQANAAGRAAAALPNATGDSVDRAARAVITDAGFGEFFIHRTGHGLGIDIHEPPFMVGGDTNQINPGMTFTVEPGIYLPGELGVRIEDMVVRTQMGADTMTTFPRELHIITE